MDRSITSIAPNWRLVWFAAFRHSTLCFLHSGNLRFIPVESSLFPLTKLSEVWCEAAYGDLVGVLLADLLDLFAPVSCGEKTQMVTKTESSFLVQSNQEPSSLLFWKSSQWQPANSDFMSASLQWGWTCGCCLESCNQTDSSSTSWWWQPSVTSVGSV